MNRIWDAVGWVMFHYINGVLTARDAVREKAAQWR